MAALAANDEESMRAHDGAKCRLLALFRTFEISGIMSVTVGKAEVISEKSENSFSMSVIRGLSGSVFRPVKTAVYDPSETFVVYYLLIYYVSRLHS